jgi:hypothetical protein
MRNGIPTHFSSKIRSLALTVFEIKIKIYLPNVEVGSHYCKSTDNSEYSFGQTNSGEEPSVRGMLQEFAFVDL